MPPWRLHREDGALETLQTDESVSNINQKSSSKFQKQNPHVLIILLSQKKQVSFPLQKSITKPIIILDRLYTGFSFEKKRVLTGILVQLPFA